MLCASPTASPTFLGSRPSSDPLLHRPDLLPASASAELRACDAQGVLMMAMSHALLREGALPSPERVR